jgi:antitoxin CptB
MISRSQLIWQCRRGSLELDVLLLRYLDQRYEEAETSEQTVFRQLLALEDQQIFHYLSDQAEPDTAELINLVARIRTLIPNTS